MSEEVQRTDRTVTELTFEFLDELRVSDDAPNMFGAWRDLMEEFGFNKATAKSLLKDWMYLRREGSEQS